MARSVPRPYAALGQRIDAARARQGMSGRELARRVHLSEGYFPRVLSGKVRPEPQTLQAIADELGVNYDELARLAGYTRGPQPPGDPEERDLDERHRRRPLWLKRAMDALADSMLKNVPVRDDSPDQ